MSVIAKTSRCCTSSPRRSRYFFKIFLPKLCLKHLRIPPAFHRHIDVKAPSRFYLKGPSNAVWAVDFVKNSDGLFLAGGWEGFVSDHSLVTGDFLLFQYDGNSTFSVMVFDKTACEKELAFSALPKCAEDFAFSLGKNEENEVEEMPASLRKRTEAVQTVSITNQTLKRKRSVTNAKRDSGFITMSTSKLSDRSYKTPERLIFFNHMKLNSIKQDCYSGFISQRRHITEKEKHIAFVNAQSFKSKNPFAMMIMRKSFVYYGFYLGLPASFALEHLPDVTTEIFLHDPTKRQWKVKYIRAKSPALSAGWSKFATANNLETDDVCIFEVIKECHIKVHIIRVVEDIKPLLRFSKFKRLALMEK